MDKEAKSSQERFAHHLRNFKKENNKAKKEVLLSNAFMNFTYQFENYKNLYILHSQNNYQPWSNFTFQKELEFKNNYGFFSNLNFFALNKEKNIFFSYDTKFAFNRDNYIEIFQQRGLFPPAIEFIDALNTILTLRNENGPYWKYIYYKQENNCSHCIFDVYQYFRYFEENLLFVNDFEDTILLCEKNYKLPVMVSNNYLSPSIKQPSLKQFKAITDFLKMNVNKLNQVKKQEQILLQNIIKHLHKNHGLFNLIDEINKSKLDNGLNVRVIQGQMRIPQNNLEYIQEYFAKELDFPECFFLYLQYLGVDSLNIIDQLAMTIARINLSKSENTIKNISPKITIILTPQVQLLKTFFKEIYADGLTIKNMTDLCDFKKIEHNIIAKINGTILYLIECKGNEKEEHFKILKKFIKLSPVTKKDKAVGKITFISNCHYVLIVDKQKDLIAFKNYFQNIAEVIILKGSNEVEDSLNLSTYDYNWIHTFFATYGLLLLTNTREHEIKIRNKVEFDIDTVIKEFMNDCCFISAEKDCYADELYMLYSQYIKTKYGLNPVKRIHLINFLKLDGRFVYCRLRHKSTDNKWGFKGLSIIKEKQGEYGNLHQNDLFLDLMVKQLAHIQNEIHPLIKAHDIDECIIDDDEV